MPVVTTYPGIYIQELPSSTHTITAVPTSVTVFVGYTHPFKTKYFNKPIELFSFTDYQTWFGGFFRSSVFDPDPLLNPSNPFGDVAQAVNQFFQNGGADAFVIGLQAQSLGQPITPAKATVGPLVFTAREIIDADHQMQVTISNVRATYPASAFSSPPPSLNIPYSFSLPFSSPSDDTCDITISFGPPPTSPLAGFGYVTEVYRGVSFNQLTPAGKPNPNFIGAQIGSTNTGTQSGTTQPGNTYAQVSSLVSVQVPLGAGPLVVGSQMFTPSLAAGTTIFNSLQFANVFQQDTALDKLAIFNLLVIPGVTDFETLSAATAFCELKRAFLIIDPPQADSADGSDPPGSTLIQDDFESGTIPKSQNSALYFPYLTTTDPLTGQVTNPFTNLPYEMPPSGTVAGIFANTDLTRGVWKAPAGLATTLTGVIDVAERGRMNDARQGVLNLIGVNCVRNFKDSGPVVWGARTSISENVAFQQWKYIPVRRMALFLEQTLYANLAWVVFEPNDTPLWTAIVTSIQSFMLGLFRQGAFQGSTPSQAFQVKCDSSTTTSDDQNNGIVNILVAFAPLKPAEFVVIQIAQLAGQSQS